jgi:Resolvase, N terminal domain
MTVSVPTVIASVEWPRSCCTTFGGNPCPQAQPQLQPQPAPQPAASLSTHEGWRLIPDHFDDGAFSGASLDRPALQKLLTEVRTGKIDVIVVYKVDRLTRALSDFAKLVELFDQHSVSFVSVTQSFNTTSSMGRLTLNVPSRGI